MKQNCVYSLLPLALLLALTLGACGDGGEKDSQPPETLSWQLVKEDPADPFTQAPDRGTLEDGESQRLMEVSDLILEKATVGGKTCLRATGGSGTQVLMTPTEDTLFTLEQTTLRITTAEGTRRLAEHCRGDLLLTQDGKALLYASGKAAGSASQRQVYRYDLATGEETQVTRQTQYSYLPCGWVSDHEILCCRSLGKDFQTVSLAVVDLDGGEIPLELDIDSQTEVQAAPGYFMTAPYTEMALKDGIHVWAWTGEPAPEEVYHFQEGLAPAGQKLFAPDGSQVAIAWVQDAQWHLRLADLPTGEETDLPLPSWENDPSWVISHWQGDGTLALTGILTGETPGEETWVACGEA